MLMYDVQSILVGAVVYIIQCIAYYTTHIMFIDMYYSLFIIGTLLVVAKYKSMGIVVLGQTARAGPRR